MNGLGSTTAVADRDVLHPTCSDDFRAERKYLSGVEHVNAVRSATVSILFFFIALLFLFSTY